MYFNQNRSKPNNSKSENFYNNYEVVRDLAKVLEISPNDLILDIGSGHGNISHAIIEMNSDVHLIEINSSFCDISERRFAKLPNFKVLNMDFVTCYQLPSKNYKVLANIPYSETSNIVRKLTNDQMNFIKGILFMEKAAGDRFITDCSRIKTKISTDIGYYYDVTMHKHLNKYDFKPIPTVESSAILFSRNKRDYNPQDYRNFKEFTEYLYSNRVSNVGISLKRVLTRNQIKRVNRKLLDKIPSELSQQQYEYLFPLYQTNGSKYKISVSC